MRLNLRMEMNLFTEAQLEKLFQDALRVWKEVPFRIQGTQELFDYLTDYGCEVQGELVRFPPAVVKKVLDRVHAEKRNWKQTENPTRPDIAMFTHGQALHICDLETNKLRPAREEDLVKWCHLVDALGDLERLHPTFIPMDVPRGAAEFHSFTTILLHSRRPHRVSVYSAKMLPFFIEAIRIAKGSMDEVKRDPVFGTKCWVNSPFMITRENIEIAMDARRLLGVPLSFGHMPVAGAAGPITVAGSLVQNTAESLGLCAIRLAVDDLLHEITPSCAIMDMRAACHRQSGPDLLLHRLAGAEMNAFLFGWKPEVRIIGVAAPTVSPQSLFEKAQAAAFNIAAGETQIGIGCLAFSDVGSPVQLILDFEMVQFYQHLFRDVSADDEHVGLDTILQTAPRGAFFLESDHTAAHFREESWLPELIDNRVPLAWSQNPTDMIEQARNKTRKLYNTAVNQCPLSEDQKKEITSLIKEADQAVGKG